MKYREPALWVIGGGLVWIAACYVFFHRPEAVQSTPPARNPTASSETGGRGRNNGRYEILFTSDTQLPGQDTYQPIIIKLDTTTGNAWTYENSLVTNTETKVEARAMGWKPIADSLEKEMARLTSPTPTNQTKTAKSKSASSTNHVAGVTNQTAKATNNATTNKPAGGKK